MHFGQYLLKKKEITTGQLIEAFVYQLANLPSLLAIIHENKILTPERLLEIIQRQIDENSDLPPILIHHAGMSEQDLRKVFALQSEHRIPLGQILVKKKFLFISDAQRLLGDFLENHDEKRTIDNRDRKPQAPRTDVIDIPEFLNCFEKYPIEEGVAKDYLELFDENKKDSLEVVVLSWSKQYAEGKAQSIKESFRDFYRELHTLKGTARFLRAHVSEFIIHNLEELLSSIQQVVSELNNEDYDLIEALYLNGLDIIWDLRMEIQGTLSEKLTWDNHEWKRNCTDFLENVKAYKQRVEKIEVTISVDDF